MKTKFTSVLAFLLGFICISCNERVSSFDPLPYVNPFIGTLEMGNTYPGAQVPFGMISISPNTVFENYAALDSYDSRPGYSYAHDRISGFSLTHFSGIGCHAMQDLPITFTTHELSSSPATNKHAYAHSFAKVDERASPGYYRVDFAEDQFAVATTVSERSGLIYLENNSGQPMKVILNPNGTANGVTDSRIDYDRKANALSGFATSGGFCDRDPSIHPYTIYFYIQFDRQPAEFGSWQDEQLKKCEKTSLGATSAFWLSFSEINQSLLTKVGISYVSAENARENAMHEIGGNDFSSFHEQARANWRQALSKIQVHDEGMVDEKTVFYTALYHNMLQPSIFQDVNGQYIGFDDAIHDAPAGRNVYTNFSLWDTYRTSVQLQARLFPDHVSDMVNSMLLFTQQSHGGLPVWSLNNVDNGVMNGYSAYPFIANAHAYGARNFDLQLAIDLMKQAAEEELEIKNGRGWEELDLYKQYGYLPADLVSRYSVSKNMEYSIADFSLAQLCLAAGDISGYQKYYHRSKNVFNNLNPETGYFQPRNADGSWHEPFSPISTFGFNEGNAAQYNFCIAHHFDEFVSRLGKEKVETQLDSLMSRVLTHGWHIRQPYYWLGNEPVFGVNYLYNLLGNPEKNDQLNREIMTHFKATADGLAGNDDAGAMSALFVWKALGQYPLITGKDTLVKSQPLFREVIGW